MGVMEEQARFLVAKYGTAAGPTGLPLERFNPQAGAALDVASLMILLGFLLLVAILFVIVRDFQVARQSREDERRRAAAIRREAHGFA